MTEENQPNLEKLSRTQVLVFIGVTALILLIIAQVWQKIGLVEIIPLQFTYSDFIKGIIVGIAIIMTSAILAQLWPEYRRSAEKYLDFVITPLVIPDLIWVGLLPGLSEELLFRGIMIPALGYDWFALIISSFFFGALHWNGQENWHYVVWAMIIGFVLGYSAYATDNLLVPVVAHILTNFCSSLFWKLRNLSPNLKI